MFSSLVNGHVCGSRVHFLSENEMNTLPCRKFGKQKNIKETKYH